MNMRSIFMILAIATAAAGLIGATTTTSAFADPWAFGYPKDKCFNGYDIKFNSCRDNDWLTGH